MYPVSPIRMTSQHKIIQILITVICIGCIIAGITLCILDYLKAGIALIVIGGFIGVLLYCDSRIQRLEQSYQSDSIAVVVIKEEGLSNH